VGCCPSLTLRAFVARNGPPDHFVCLRQTAPHTNNGLKLNDAAVSDPKLVVDASALNSDGVLKLSSGKKKHVLVKPA